MDLDPNHFLSLPRPDTLLGPPPGAPDTTTVAAHDFDVDTRTGFMPPQPPLSRLPIEWEPWESTLDSAVNQKLRLGDTPHLSPEEKTKSLAWRNHVQNLPILPTSHLTKSEITLRRAHHVLAWILHFYIHSLPPSPDTSIRIPLPLSFPLLAVSSHLRLPPVLTYSDDVLYNWSLLTPSPPHLPRPALTNLCCQTTFTSTQDEEAFYLTSARIELKGVDALEVMQAIMDEAFVGDALAVRRITAYLATLADVIRELRGILLSVREQCDPEVFYNEIRPWFRGVDSVPGDREWVFEGSEGVVEELSGPSAGQSALIHALDVFLGVDQYMEEDGEEGEKQPSFMKRMQAYMPRHHRAFLAHLAASPRPLRAFVENAVDEEDMTEAGPASLSPRVLREAYNDAVLALKEFRDAHLQIVALYIVGPSRRGRREGECGMRLRGTGGTQLVRFLKGVRDRTEAGVLRQDAA